MRTVNAKCGAIIPIGRLGENEATAVVFDVADYEALYGVGTFTLLFQRCGDPAPYPCSIEHDGDTVTWTVTNIDLGVQGYGKCELVYTVGETVAKSVIYTTVTGAALTGGIDPPEPWEDWVQRVLDAAENAHIDAIDAAASAGEAAESAQAAAASAADAEMFAKRVITVPWWNAPKDGLAKIDADGRARRCEEGDVFDGKVLHIRGTDAGTVADIQVSGLMKVAYYGQQPPLGFTNLVAAGADGEWDYHDVMISDAGGRQALVLSVDTEEQEAQIYLFDAKDYASIDLHNHATNTDIHVTAAEKTAWDSKSTVSVSATGTATDEVKYITIGGVEKKLAGDVIVVKYGVSTYAEVQAAYNAAMGSGKPLFCVSGATAAPLTETWDGTYYFTIVGKRRISGVAEISEYTIDSTGWNSNINALKVDTGISVLHISTVPGYPSSTWQDVVHAVLLGNVVIVEKVDYDGVLAQYNFAGRATRNGQTVALFTYVGDGGSVYAAYIGSDSVWHEETL